MSPPELFVAGAGAALTPALALPATLVAFAAFVFGPRRGWRHHLAAAVVILLAVALGLARRGLEPLSLGGSIVLALLAVVLVDLGRRGDDGPPRNTLLWALLLGLGVVLLRAPIYGPALADLMGSWEERAAFGPLAVYHAGSAAALTAVYLIAAFLGARIGSRSWLGWTAVVGAAVFIGLALTGLLPTIQSQLLLRWPVVVAG